MSRSRESNLRPSAYQPSPLPPGQAGSSSQWATAASCLITQARMRAPKPLHASPRTVLPTETFDVKPSPWKLGYKSKRSPEEDSRLSPQDWTDNLRMARERRRRISFLNNYQTFCLLGNSPLQKQQQKPTTLCVHITELKVKKICTFSSVVQMQHSHSR